MKKSKDEKKDRMLSFDDIPLGGRFKYPGSNRIWVVIQKYRKHSDTEPMHGTIVEWKYNSKHSVFSSICTHDPNEKGLPKKLEMIDHFREVE